jgi:uncharacterized membrane protein
MIESEVMWIAAYFANQHGEQGDGCWHIPPMHCCSKTACSGILQLELNYYYSKTNSVGHACLCYGDTNYLC